MVTGVAKRLWCYERYSHKRQHFELLRYPADYVLTVHLTYTNIYTFPTAHQTVCDGFVLAVSDSWYAFAVFGGCCQMFGCLADIEFFIINDIFFSSFRWRHLHWRHRDGNEYGNGMSFLRFIGLLPIPGRLRGEHRTGNSWRGSFRWRAVSIRRWILRFVSWFLSFFHLNGWTVEWCLPIGAVSWFLFLWQLLSVQTVSVSHFCVIWSVPRCWAFFAAVLTSFEWVNLKLFDFFDFVNCHRICGAICFHFYSVRYLSCFN